VGGVRTHMDDSGGWSAMNGPIEPGAVPLLRTSALARHYGSGTGLVRAVDGIDLSVNAGETVAVIGPSGC
ncbi:MAG: ABC transporter ATP-binding protein, partial [Jatrophihabitantaceae bacterium]